MNITAVHSDALLTSLETKRLTTTSKEESEEKNKDILSSLSKVPGKGKFLKYCFT